jgi:copper(I)-binding protein
MIGRTVVTVALAGILGACTSTSLIEVRDARIPMPAGPNAAVYFDLTNRTGTDDVLVGVESDIADAALHQTTTNGDLVQMQPVDSVAIPAGQTVEFASGGFHVMLMNVPPLQIGDTVSVTLLFRNAGPVPAEAKVQQVETP